MAIAIQLRMSPTNVPDRAEVETIFDGHQRVLEEQEIQFKHIDGDQDVGVPEHHVALYRFDDGEDRDVIEAEFSEDIFAEISWYKIEWHDCSHDKGGGPCPGWTMLRERGAVPEEL